MNKIVTIHQPNYIPWLGFFSKIKNADCYVVLDTVEYTKNSVINRNKIRTRDGWCYLTIPIEAVYHDSKICDVKLPLNNKWQDKHWRSIKANYSQAEHFDEYAGFFEDLYCGNFEYLCNLNLKLIKHLLTSFGITTEIIKASDLGVDPTLKKTDLLLEILGKLNATTYLSGPSGRGYLDAEKFEKSSIELDFFEFTPPVYKQRFPGFEKGMSAIDALFNTGMAAKQLLDTKPSSV